MSAQELKPAEVEYPETPGEPMESDLHRDLMHDLIVSAREHFRDIPDVYVSGNLHLYFEEGNPKKVVSPDFFVVRGISKGRRRVYKVWVEGKGPEVVVELTSPTTHREDLGRKRAVYESLGVQEYFLFDPEGIRLRPPLKGFRLRDRVFQLLAPSKDSTGALVLPSEVMGLELHAREESLRLVDPRTGESLPVPEEMIRRAEAERRRADAEGERVEAERKRAETERKRAETERKRAEAAEEELARAREEIARLKQDQA